MASALLTAREPALPSPLKGKSRRSLPPGLAPWDSGLCPPGMLVHGSGSCLTIGGLAGREGPQESQRRDAAPYLRWKFPLCKAVVKERGVSHLQAVPLDPT